MPERTAPRLIHHLDGMLSIPDGEVSDKARRQLAVAGLAPQRLAAWRVTPAHASSGVRPNLTQAMFIARCRLAKGLVPGLKSVATAIGTVLAQQLDRRFTGFIKEVERAGEQGCHGAAFAHRRHALFRQILDMVGGKPMIAAHQLRAAQR